MDKIIYVRFTGLEHDRIKEVIAHYPDLNWELYIGLSKINPDSLGAYTRHGVNSFPLKNDIVDILNCRMPDYDPDYRATFDDVTDLRLKQLWSSKNKKWLINWSGGIDSTVVVTSILKNLKPADFKDITVACSRFSVYENPNFFFNFIKPNFSIIDSSQLDVNQEVLNNYIVIDGEMADQLYGGVLNTKTIDDNEVDFLSKDWRRDPDKLLSIMESKFDKKFAELYYENMKTRIESCSIPIETYYDFFWWDTFDSKWAPIKFRPLLIYNSSKNIADAVVNNNPVHWYDSQEYQMWAMNNNTPGIKYNIDLGERKLASKKYIYNFTNDSYYYKFKLKMDSLSRQSAKTFFAVTNDYTKLYLDTDLDQILELLPTHINQGN